MLGEERTRVMSKFLKDLQILVLFVGFFFCFVLVFFFGWLVFLVNYCILLYLEAKIFPLQKKKMAHYTKHCQYLLSKLNYSAI